MQEKLGEILLKISKLTEKQLSEVLKIQQEKPILIGELLVQKGYSTSEDVARGLAVQFGLEYFKNISPAEIDTSLIKNIPINFAKQNELIPIKDQADFVLVAVANPFRFEAIDDLKLIFNKRVEMVLTTSVVINDAINKVYERETTDKMGKMNEEFEENLYDLEEPEDLLEASDEEAPIVRLVHKILFQAIKDKASDIHIEPYEREQVVRFRIDGVLYDIFKPPKSYQQGVVSRLKVMGDMDIAEKRMPQDGRIKIKLAGKDIDIRVSTVPIAAGERVVLRILDKSQVVLDLPTLGFTPDILKTIQKLISKKHGILLVTGPTGSGKSTTLASCLNIITSPERNIITIEDPIEYALKGVSQIQVNNKINLTFARGLRHILRQDPDVIMVGEIRDQETAEISINASLTGHFVLSTLHTNDAAGSITRLIDMGVEPFLVASSLEGVIGQRLVRKLCPNCSEPGTVSKEEARLLNIPFEWVDGKTVRKPVGCSLCSNHGHKGRTVIHELLVITDDIRASIMSKADSTIIKKQAIKNGMLTMQMDALERVYAGQISLQEMVKSTQLDAAYET